MIIDPRLLTAVGDVFLNLAAGWFGAAVIFPGSRPRPPRENIFFVIANVLFGVIALAVGYKFRTLGI